jgi:hypothetical protein
MRCGKMVTLSLQSSLERWNGKAGNVEEVPRTQNNLWNRIRNWAYHCRSERDQPKCSLYS